MFGLNKADKWKYHATMVLCNKDVDHVDVIMKDDSCSRFIIIKDKIKT